jgi:hypothetical protein
MKNISGIACKWKLSEKFVSILIINFNKTPKLCYRQHNSNEHTTLRNARILELHIYRTMNAFQQDWDDFENESKRKN